MPEEVIVDASAMVELLVGSPLATAIRNRLQGYEPHAPAHFDAEVLSALGRSHRGGHLTTRSSSNLPALPPGSSPTSGSTSAEPSILVMAA
jgi:predicted nucleic acid-binding protein